MNSSTQYRMPSLKTHDNLLSQIDQVNRREYILLSKNKIHGLKQFHLKANSHINPSYTHYYFLSYQFDSIQSIIHFHLIPRQYLFVHFHPQGHFYNAPLSLSIISIIPFIPPQTHLPTILLSHCLSYP